MLPIQLLTITFNHDTASARQSALNVRRNAGEPVITPEWRRGLNTRPTDSVAAYALDQVTGETLRIGATFRTLDPQLTRIEVRAVSDQPLSSWPWNLPGGMQPSGINSSILGAAKATEVVFSSGQSDLTLFELEGARIGMDGVGVFGLNWWWQCRLDPNQPWETFALSRHSVYVLLAVPTAPWQQEGYPHNTQLPWIEVLDYACRWAQGALTLDRAATRITQAVFDLGPQLLEYNCPNAGAPAYVSPDIPFAPAVFNCSGFLDLLHGGFGLGRYLNCSDCASIVSTFANALGCDLSQARMGTLPGGFVTNPIRPIGHVAWAHPCGQPGFGMHEVAWKGACTENDEVFDACLQIDADPDPTRLPHVPFLPTNVRFGQAGEGSYRDRLAAPLSTQNCQPMAGTQQRRFVV